MQVRHTLRGSGTVNCAVAVRENDDILGVDYCDTRYPPKFFRRLNGGGGVIKRSGSSYYVSIGFTHADGFFLFDELHIGITHVRC